MGEAFRATGAGSSCLDPRGSGNGVAWSRERGDFRFDDLRLPASCCTIEAKPGSQHMSEAKTRRDLDVIERTDANLKTYAHDAGKRAHDRGLDQRGSVVKALDGKLMRQHRDGSVEVLRSLPDAERSQAGTILKRR